MKRLLTLTLAGLALALPATALADAWVNTSMGINASSRAAKGSCSTRKVSLTRQLALRCDGATGYALARYDFTLPDSLSGTAKAHVDSTGSPSVQLVKLDDRHLRVIVRTSGPSRVLIASVSVGYCS